MKSRTPVTPMIRSDGHNRAAGRTNTVPSRSNVSGTSTARAMHQRIKLSPKGGNTSTSGPPTTKFPAQNRVANTRNACGGAFKLPLPPPRGESGG
ncbi:MAG: hypothetical protein H0X71_00995 [Rubrobacter sp.]|nr:hypothetical protein [Rubrobacter sp.]